MLSRLVIDHHRKISRRRETVLSEDASIVEQEDPRAWEEIWRDEFLTAAWKGLAELEVETDTPWMTVLKLRVEHPDDRSVDLAERLTLMWGQPVSATRLRVMLHRSREKFAGYLIDAVIESVGQECPDRIEQELIDLRLLVYCESVFRRRYREPS